MVTILGNQYEGILSKIKLGNKYYAIQDLRIGQVPQKTVNGNQVDQTVIEYIQTLTGGETGLGTRLTYLEGKFLIQKPGLDDHYSLADYLDHYTETELDTRYADISYEDAVDELMTLHATRTGGQFKKTVAEEIADYKTSTLDNAYAAKSIETTVSLHSTRLQQLSSGTGSESGDINKSIRAIAAEEVAKIVANADASYDTLKEIADWILSDTTGAAKMVEDIGDIQDFIGDIGTAQFSVGTGNDANTLIIPQTSYYYPTT